MFLLYFLQAMFWAFTSPFVYNFTASQPGQYMTILDLLPGLYQNTQMLYTATNYYHYQQGPWASPLPTVASALWSETPIQYPCGSRERI